MVSKNGNDVDVTTKKKKTNSQNDYNHYASQSRHAEEGTYVPNGWKGQPLRKFPGLTGKNRLNITMLSFYSDSESGQRMSVSRSI